MSVGATLPIIDISPFLPNSQSSPGERQQCARTLASACRDTGFFYLTNHGIPGSQTDEILSLARTFFLSATEAEKASIARQDAGVGTGDGARGYQKAGENVTTGKRDWHEAIDLYRDVHHSPTPPYTLCHGPNRWPASPPTFEDTYRRYIHALLGLGEAVVRAMGHALDPAHDDVFVDHTRASFWVMRIIGYPPLPPARGATKLEVGMEDGELGISCGEHTDYGCVTFLLADETKGALQVQHRSGAWITADPLPGAFVVNIGDMMERWTNGLWKSTRHRVVHQGSDWRVSVPFFFEPDFAARIEPLDVCVQQTGGTAKYSPKIYGEHLLHKVGRNFYG
ncbi:MAG: hypothetical protein M1838_003360 [Thelocarpon superellum]|nr:MAG: hypothetical protein M1838_003360 [Thelocarpon superellum]